MSVSLWVLRFAVPLVVLAVDCFVCRWHLCVVVGVRDMLDGQSWTDLSSGGLIQLHEMTKMFPYPTGLNLKSARDRMAGA